MSPANTANSAMPKPSMRSPLALISGVFLINSGMKNTEMAGTRNNYFQSKEVMKPPANTPIAAAK